MKISLTYLLKITILILVIGVQSCNQENVDFLGPAIAFAPDDFVVDTFSVSKTAIDFTQDSVVVNAKFSRSVSWILTLKGQKSGAVREMRGLSNELDELVWRGGHDNVEFFKTGESVSAILSFFGSTKTVSESITLTREANLKSCGLFPVGGDFENEAAIDFPSWARFNVADQGVDSAAIDYNGKLVPSVQGKSYYYIKGLGTQPVFVDGIQFLGPWSYTLPANPEEVWLNIHVYGTGDPNLRLDIELQEEDADGSSFGYTGTDDDAFVATVIADHVGWKLFSFKYSDLPSSANADFGGSGNKTHEPDRMKSVVFVLLKNSNPDAPVELYFDYPIWTTGGPFKGCKL